MHANAAYRRAGMTLVELLVVVAILGLLAVAVLPVFSGSAEPRRTREATRIITSFVAKAQAHAIGRNEWAGFWLATPATNGSAPFAIDLFTASVPAAYRGDTLEATVTVASGSTAPELSSMSVSGTLGDLIRFDGKPPWYEMVTGTTFRLRSNAGQTALNTPWPTSAAHTFELLRPPRRIGSPLSLPDGRCVDLFWSGHGGTSSYTPLNAPPGGIAAVFDATGRLRQLFGNGTRIDVDGPLFLLVGRTDRAGQSMATLAPGDDSLGANWQYADSFWIAIDPLGGVAKSAECKPGAASVVDSQEFIRSEFLATGR